MFGMVSVIFLSTLSGCDRNADNLIPNESTKYPAVIEIGELELPAARERGGEEPLRRRREGRGGREKREHVFSGEDGRCEREE